MASFQTTREQTEQKMIVRLLSEVERNPALTQRGLATELGIALGLMNHYLKRCITKGWIRVSQVSPRRIKYFLTAEGLTEKSAMVAEYLTRSLTFFRDARTQCEGAFAICLEKHWLKVALVGDGDLADIAQLVAYSLRIEVTIVDAAENLGCFDAVLITDILSPQGTYELIKSKIEYQRIFTPELLHITRNRLVSSFV